MAAAKSRLERPSTVILKGQDGGVTALAYEDWADTRERRSFRDSTTLWIAASILVHLALFAWILASPDFEPMSMSDETMLDRPAVEVVMVQLERRPAPPPDADVTTDEPDSALPPPVRELNRPSDLQIPPGSDIGTIDPRALNAYVKRLEELEAEVAGQGATWKACSLLSPERRVLEPACDGLLLQRGEGPGVAASLVSPDGEVMAAIKRIEDADPKAKAKRNGNPREVSVGEDNREDRSFRNESDDRFGPAPWE